MAAQLKIAGIIRESIVDGPGIRFVVFTQGCSHRCPGCHNPQTHDPEDGNWISTDRTWAPKWPPQPGSKPRVPSTMRS